jgi:hypothetical protein
MSENIDKEFNPNGLYSQGNQRPKEISMWNIAQRAIHPNSQKMKEEAKRDSTLRFSRLAIRTTHALKNFQLGIKKERVKFSFWKWWANIEPKISLKEKLQYATFVLQNND